MKGDIYIEDFLRKELNEIFMKSNARNSIKPAQTKYFNFELNNMRWAKQTNRMRRNGLFIDNSYLYFTYYIELTIL